MPVSRNGNHASKVETEVQDPELRELGRELASLALDRARQDGCLNVRQREQLRRALSRAAEARDWILIAGTATERITAATRDLAVLAEAGARSLGSDVADLIASKNGEMKQLRQVAQSVQKLAMDASAAYPTEVEYSHTARHGSQSFVTKTQTLTLTNADEAHGAVASLEKSMEGWTRLKDNMLEDLEHRQHQVEQMRGSLSGFLDASRGLVGEVLAVLV